MTTIKIHEGTELVNAFTQDGFICWTVKTNRLGGYLCGYVGIPAGNFWYDAEYIEHLEVHGGITFDELSETQRIIGFDCAHSCDLDYATTPPTPVRGPNYVKKELKNLTKQLLKAPGPVYAFTEEALREKLDIPEGLELEIYPSGGSAVIAFRPVQE